MRDGIARARWARRSGDGHGCLPDSVALVLLASCSMSRWTSRDPSISTTGRRRDPAGDRRGGRRYGERSPPAKDLAAVLGVNTNTVLRSLRVLRDEGLLEFRRGRGVSVVVGPRARGRCPESQGAGRLRPTAGLPWTSWSKSSRKSAGESRRSATGDTTTNVQHASARGSVGREPRV